MDLSIEMRDAVLGLGAPLLVPHDRQFAHWRIAGWDGGRRRATHVTIEARQSSDQLVEVDTCLNDRRFDERFELQRLFASAIPDVWTYPLAMTVTQCELTLPVDVAEGLALCALDAGFAQCGFGFYEERWITIRTRNFPLDQIELQIVDPATLPPSRWEA